MFLFLDYWTFYPFQVDTILDKENFKLEDLLDEDEIIQECKALNTRLINLYWFFSKAIPVWLFFPLISNKSWSKLSVYCSLRDKVQVEQLLRYIVEEAPEDAEKKRIFRYEQG